jgi:peptide/nickel transport system permease protein
VLPTLIGVTFVIFMFQRLIPGDPAVAMLGEHASEENVARIREQLGLNRPMFLDREALKQGDLGAFFDTQYLLYLGRLIRLDLGDSIHRRIPVAETLAIRFPATVSWRCYPCSSPYLWGTGRIISASGRLGIDSTTMIGSLVGCRCRFSGLA